jgi:signal transduction histidine kinase
MLREESPAGLAPRFDRALELVDEGIKNLRSLTNDLRPSLLDDLGLLPALRALVTAFEERTGLPATLALPAAAPTLPEDAELALYRAVQETLANIARHADARAVEVALAVLDRQIVLTVRDDGRGLPAGWSLDSLQREGHLGLAGMRERISALGGVLRVAAGPDGGVVVTAQLPLKAGGAGAVA